MKPWDDFSQKELIELVEQLTEQSKTEEAQLAAAEKRATEAEAMFAEMHTSRQDAIWLIHFDDQERRPEVFASEAAAREAFNQASAAWNAHLFVKVLSNSRDDPNADKNALLAIPARAQAVAEVLEAADKLPCTLSEELAAKGMPRSAKLLLALQHAQAKLAALDKEQ